MEEYEKYCTNCRFAIDNYFDVPCCKVNGYPIWVMMFGGGCSYFEPVQQ